MRYSGGRTLLQEDAVSSFIQRLGDRITGILSGFDRILFRGYLRQFLWVGGLVSFMNWRRVLRVDFGEFSQQLTTQIIETSLAEAQRLGRTIQHVPSPRTRKDDLARDIAQQHSIREGLICVLSCVEPGTTFRIGWDKKSETGVLQKDYRHPHKHLYHYYFDPAFGFMHVRLQTWLPFTMQIYINGREWLARQMDAVGMRYERYDNCFPSIEDVGAAQKLMDRQLVTNWRQELRRLSRLANPKLHGILGSYHPDYFWSLSQSEWATDIMFRSGQDLAELFPKLARHAITALSCEDVMRFLLGRKLHLNFDGEIVSDYSRRMDGIRTRHSVNRNSGKAYDKAVRPDPKKPAILRLETTINDAREFRVLRPKHGAPGSKPEVRPLRQGISDIAARAKISQQANDRYMEALATADTSTAFREIFEKLDHPVRWNGQRVRALRAASEDDLNLFRAICRGDFLLNGFRNRDLQSILFEKPLRTSKQRRRRRAAVTRQIRMLRAHGLIRKMPRSHRYKLSKKGTQLLMPLLALQDVSLAQIQNAA